MAKPKRTDLTQERVRELFDYREDGELVRRVWVNTRARKGSVAGTYDKDGYRHTSIEGRIYFNHRLVFLWHHGYMPENDIDHINRNKSDNRIENLREVSKSCNARNNGMCAENTSGVSRVCWRNYEHRPSGKCWAQIKVDGWPRYLGYFDDFTEAVAHRLAAEQCLDWPNCNSSTSAYLYMQEYLKERGNDTNGTGITTSKTSASHQGAETIPD